MLNHTLTLAELRAMLERAIDFRHDVVRAKAHNPDNICIDQYIEDIRHDIKSGRWKTVKDRNADIVLRINSGETLATVAERYHISRSRVMQIAKQETQKLRHAVPMTDAASNSEGQRPIPTLASLSLTTRTLNALARAGIRTVADVHNYVDGDWERLTLLRNIGRKGIAELRARLDESSTDGVIPTCQ
jgi:hypothetical protein